MAGQQNYFLLNKESDFTRGFCDNMEIVGSGIRPANKVGAMGVFVSRLFDSKEERMNWHRMTLTADGEAEGVFRLGIYTSDVREFVYGDENTDLEDFIRRTDVPWEEKLEVLSGYLKKQVNDTTDILLHDVSGRYLWIAVEMYRQHAGMRIHDIEISFPGRSIMEYLPDVYQQEDEEQFLERYLAIFQTIYEDRSRKIARQAMTYDYDSADGASLYELASWLGVKRPRVWHKEALRRLLKEGVGLFRLRGTRQGLVRLIELYTGVKPFIIEPQELRQFKKNGAYHDSLIRLYGDDENQFTVLLPQEVVDTQVEEKIVRQLINEMRPAHIAYRLVLLKPYVFAGVHTYLGVNTVLGEYSSLTLNGQSAVSFTGLK